ncbi:MAG: hypothetical protein HQ523_06090 [Lentisphaerae bacterium]|nr:hypothetical protein [Lentisphaerota bacterium]
MKSEDHKLILSCHRPGRDDPTAPELVAALAALETDTELAAWYAETCEFDATYRGALSRFSPPPMDQVMIAPRRNVVYWPRLLAAAALVIMLGSAAFLMRRSPASTPGHTVASFRQDMASYAAGGVRLDFMNNNLASLQEFITTRGGMNGSLLPGVFASAMPKGCQLIKWQDSSVSLYCFANDRMQVVHAFLLPTSEISEAVLGELAEMQVHSGLQTGGWVAGETVYLLVGSQPGVDIGPFLALAQEGVASLRRPSFRTHRDDHRRRPLKG